MIDSIILSKFNIKGIKGILIIVLSYLFLGVISGIIISAFFFRLDGIINYISISIIGAMIFLFFQTLFQFLLFKLGSKQK
ncbi:hypothetical protein LPB68_21395 [Paenibacillus crassostreae]|nr:hypothetical protein LPB68_21395 [Paenibacillus crassostreae]